MTTRLTWTHQGMGAIGDADGSIHISTAWLNGQRIERHSPARRPTTYYVHGACYRRLRDAVQATEAPRG